MPGGIYYAGKALYYQRHVSRHVGTGLTAVKSLLLDARKRVSLVVTYWQPFSCFIFLRLLLDILLNLFCIFPCLYPRATYTPPYQAYVPILSASGYTCNIPNTPLRQNSFTKLLFLYQEHLVIHAIPPALKLPYQAYVSILSTSGYTCNILCAGILVPVFCISVRLIAHLSLYCYSL